MPEKWRTFDAISNVDIEDGALLVKTISTTGTATDIWKWTDGSTNVRVFQGALEIDAT